MNIVDDWVLQSCLFDHSSAFMSRQVLSLYMLRGAELYLKGKTGNHILNYFIFPSTMRIESTDVFLLAAIKEIPAFTSQRSENKIWKIFLSLPKVPKIAIERFIEFVSKIFRQDEMLLKLNFKWNISILLYSKTNVEEKYDWEEMSWKHEIHLYYYDHEKRKSKRNSLWLSETYQ